MSICECLYLQLTSEQAIAEIDPTANAAAAGAAATAGGAGGKDAKGGGKDAKGDKKAAGGKTSAGGKGSAGKGGKKGAKKEDALVESTSYCFILFQLGHESDTSLCLDVVEATPEDLTKRQLKAKMKEEYLAALSHEGERLCRFSSL